MPTYGNEVGEDLVGLVKAMTEEVGMDLGKLNSSFVAMEEVKNLSFNLKASPAHEFLFLLRIT